ncbi:hypothetical protein BOX15_Mlig031315g1 [Macrostomum lignano]|uniref:Uncharacterized protein n=2 Tax=Macrostomum lignano TaxID=282301 RepID=A0A267EA34_9PLAT|nr:hypothetical protein BOX15_Mlig031315g1 [Macrostomum lignano]
MRLALVLVFFSVILVCAVAGRRSSFRSFRSRSYRYRSPSYRSYGGSGSFRASNYKMAPGVMRRMGGIGINKKMLLAAGSVYIAYKLRPKFHIGGGYRYDSDDYAICRGNFTGRNEQNVTISYKYFICPTDINYIIRWDNRKYCCGPVEQQYCCDKEEFYLQYGNRIVGLSGAVIAIISVLSILFLCCCCGLMLYCKFRNRRPGHHQQPTPVPTEDPAGKTASAYPMQPQAAYPPPLPTGGVSSAESAPPYPIYQPPGGAPPPNLPPPAYPGPM